MRQDLAAGEDPEEVFDVYGENVVACRLFLAVQTQWRVIGLSTMAAARPLRMGLDYVAVEVAARFCGLAVEPDDFDRLRIMEAEAITAFGEQA